MKITVLDSATLGEDLTEVIPQLFGKYGEVTVRKATTAEEVAEVIADSNIIVVNKIKLNESNIKDAKHLKLICVSATGYDNIDVDYCRQRGIAVCNVKDYSTHSVAQLTLAMVMELVCHMREYCSFAEGGDYTRSGVANRLSPVYHEISGMTWGIVGAGNIGRQVAKVAEAMGCRVIVNKQTPVKEFNCVDIDTLCKEADIISIHTPLTDKTKNLINSERIGMMKPTAVLINVARGGVTDEETLTKAIEENRLGGLGVDVYTEEPFSANHPYNRIVKSNKTCFTPHVAWGAYESRIRCVKIMADNIESYINGGTNNRVDL